MRFIKKACQATPNILRAFNIDNILLEVQKSVAEEFSYLINQIITVKND